MSRFGKNASSAPDGRCTSAGAMANPAAQPAWRAGAGAKMKQLLANCCSLRLPHVTAAALELQPGNKAPEPKLVQAAPSSY
jgi:hypothetical protein